jgi:hypothetical protein
VSREAVGVMADDVERAADPSVTGMPAVLAGILMRYDAATRRDAIRNWTVIGDEGQRDYHRQLRRAPLGWLRRHRARKLARRLITGIE